MKLETRQKFFKLAVGEILTIPWSEIPPTWAPPTSSATISIGSYVYRMSPTALGIEVARTK